MNVHASPSRTQDRALHNASLLSPYTLGELELLARLAGIESVDARTLGPVHGVVHLHGLLGN